MIDFAMEQPPIVFHFNVALPGAVLNRIGKNDMKGMDPTRIEWVWIVDLKRHATDKEIKQLCAGTWKPPVP